MNRSSNKFYLLTSVFALVMTAGCAEHSQVEREFGNSVRQVTRAQTLDSMNVVAPDPDPVDQTDGQRMEAVMETYREDVAKPEGIGQDIIIQVGK